jgi:hypothetical protein
VAFQPGECLVDGGKGERKHESGQCGGQQFGSDQVERDRCLGEMGEPAQQQARKRQAFARELVEREFPGVAQHLPCR